MPGHLLLSACETVLEPPAEPGVVTRLRKTCKKLSARKQQIAGFIETIAIPQKRPRKIPDGVTE